MTSTEIPKTMKAYICQGLGKAGIKDDVPVPFIGSDEILIRNYAAAQNPTDWQYIDRVGTANTIAGTDFAGIVVQVGSSLPSSVNVKVGDRVAGFTQGGTYEDRGAYAEYVKAAAELVWPIPEGVSFEEAATMGCSFWTAAQALFQTVRLGLVEPPAKVKEEEWVFVYGGSSSVGMYSIQLAHLAGYKVVTVASPSNWELCKSLGADAVFDYRDPEVVNKVKAVTHDTIRAAFDTISQPSSQKITVQAMRPEGGKVIVILNPDEEAANLRKEVKVQHTLIYTSLGHAFKLGKFYPPAPEDRTHMAAFLRKVPGFVSSGVVRPNPIKLWPGGLEGVSDGLQFMREGKNSGEKIVYKLVEGA